MLVTPVETESKSGRPLLLRSPLPVDAPLLLEFVRTLYQESWPNLAHEPGYFDTMPVEEEEEYLHNLKEAPRSFMVSAFFENRVIGNVDIEESPYGLRGHCASDLGIGVLEPYQGDGIGRLLLMHAIAEACAIGLWNFELRVRTHNLPAISLYESLGFKRVGRIRFAARIGDQFADEYLYQYIADI